jgi:NADPH:quinone reductase-like Zn-dependent oxidoreductase
MKAIVFKKYGPPEVLQLKEVEKPNPKDDEVLVIVHAASVNAPDWRAHRANPFFIRFQGGLLKPKNNLLGVDIAGRVEAIGRNVKQFQPGDEIFGDVYEYGLGAFAEYKCMPEEGALAIKPTNLTFEESAAVPSAAVTALQGLRDQGQIQPGQKVLIIGASGGIGTFAVQIAKSYGTEVTGVCSSRNLDMVRSIGADHVIDYTQEDFTKSGQRYDLILDIAAKGSVSDYQHALSPKGIYILCGFTLAAMFGVLFLGPRISRTGSKKFVSYGAKTNNKDLVFMKERIEAGKVVPVIDRRYPLSEVPDAIRYYEKGHAQGKVVITVEHNNKT